MTETETQRMKIQLDQIQAKILELENKRLVWLDGNKQMIDDLFFLVDHLGVNISDRFRYPWNNYKILEFKKDHIAITVFYNVGGKYSPRLKDFINNDKMSIVIGDEFTVCRYTRTNNPKPDKSDFVFIPGEWTDLLLPEIEQAKTANLEFEIEQSIKKLDELRKNLLIGIEV